MDTATIIDRPYLIHIFVCEETQPLRPHRALCGKTGEGAEWICGVEGGPKEVKSSVETNPYLRRPCKKCLSLYKKQSKSVQVVPCK